MKQEMAALIYK